MVEVETAQGSLKETGLPANWELRGGSQERNWGKGERGGSIPATHHGQRTRKAVVSSEEH